MGSLEIMVSKGALAGARMGPGCWIFIGPMLGVWLCFN